MQELPDIPGLSAADEPLNTGTQPNHHESERVVSERSVGVSLAGVLLAMLLAVMVSAGISIGAMLIALIKPEIVYSAFGIQVSEKPDVYRELIAALETRQYAIEQKADDVDLQLSRFDKSLYNHLDQADKAAFDVINIDKRVDALQKMVDGLKVSVADAKQQSKSITKTQTKTTAARKAAPKPVAPLVLLSVRQQAGVAYVSLRDGLDYSELLMPGEQWRGWQLVSAEGNRARFRVNGQEQELYL